MAHGICRNAQERWNAKIIQASNSCMRFSIDSKFYSYADDFMRIYVRQTLNVL